jgi:hypothetical protein
MTWGHAKGTIERAMVEYALVAVIVIGLFGIGYLAGGGEGPQPQPPDDYGCCLRVPDDPRELLEGRTDEGEGTSSTDRQMTHKEMDRREVLRPLRPLGTGSPFHMLSWSRQGASSQPPL